MTAVNSLRMPVLYVSRSSTNKLDYNKQLLGSSFGLHVSTMNVHHQVVTNIKNVIVTRIT
jgi:hypothetical protein